MRLVIASLITALLLPVPVIAQSESETEREVKQTIVEDVQYTKENLQARPGSYSKHGAVEFWSSGGLLNEVSPDGRPEGFDVFNIEPKHIKVITLVEGEAAVANFYSEGSLKPKGYPAVSHYLTRVTQVFVKEDGKWLCIHGHYTAVP